MSLLTVENLQISPFAGINKTFKTGSIAFIAGPSNSYKTLLVKVLAGIIKTEEMIRVNRTFIEKINSRQYPYKIQTIFSIKSFGMYAVTNVPKPSISIATRCCPPALATLPIIPLKSPFVIFTSSPPL